jgi:ABC-type transporter Mla subunit MlaD
MITQHLTKEAADDKFSAIETALAEMASIIDTRFPGSANEMTNNLKELAGNLRTHHAGMAAEIDRLATAIRGFNPS